MPVCLSLSSLENVLALVLRGGLCLWLKRSLCSLTSFNINSAAPVLLPQLGRLHLELKENCIAPAFVRLLGQCLWQRILFHRHTVLISFFFTNQQIDTTLVWCWYLVFSIMQQHLSAEGHSIVYWLSDAVTTSILHMNHPALLCHNNSSDSHWWSVRQSDTAVWAIRVSYRSGTDPTSMCICWHTPVSEAVDGWTQVCVCEL